MFVSNIANTLKRNFAGYIDHISTNPFDTTLYGTNIFEFTQIYFTGSLPDTLTIHYAVQTKDRKRMKLKQVKKKNSDEKYKKKSNPKMNKYNLKTKIYQFKISGFSSSR